MIKLVGYRVLMTCYYMLSFHMAWIEIYITVGYAVLMDLQSYRGLLPGKHKTKKKQKKF